MNDYPEFKFNSIDDSIAADLLKILLDYKIIDKREGWIRRRFNIPELTQKEQDEILRLSKKNIIKKAFEKRVTSSSNDLSIKLEAPRSDNIFCFDRLN